MDRPLSKFKGDARESKYQPLVDSIRIEIASANDNCLRHIDVAHATSLYNKIDNFQGEWVSATQGYVGRIIGTGYYFFAKELEPLVKSAIAKALK
jgi:sialate O-acetylesterase